MLLLDGALSPLTDNTGAFNTEFSFSEHLDEARSFLVDVAML